VLALFIPNEGCCCAIFYTPARTFIAAKCSGVLPALAATAPMVSLTLGTAREAPALTSCLKMSAGPFQAA
jgi:hypothetical protein